MKKLIFLSLMLICAFTVSAQQTYFPTSIPPSSISFTPTYRFIGTDSLAKFYLSNSGRFSQFYTAAQANALFLRSIATGNGLSGNGSSGSPVILGGTLTAPTIINYSLPDSLKFFDPSTSSGLFFKGGASGVINIIENNGSFHTTLGASAGSYSFQVANGGSNSGLTGSTSNGLGIIDQIKNLGIAFAGNYTTNQRLQRLSVPSVGTTIALIDSVKGTISGGGTTTHPLTLSYGLTGTSFDGSTAVATGVDTSLLETVLNFFPKADTRYVKTSALLNHVAGYGLSGSNYNTSVSQTWLVDTTAISTKYYAGIVVGADGVVSGMITTTVTTTATTTAGTYRRNNVLITIGSSTNTTIDAQNATLNRYDLIVGDASGVLSMVQGALNTDAVEPAIPANKTLIASIYIPATGGTVTTTGGGSGKGTVTKVTSSTTDILVANQTTTPVLTLNKVNGVAITYFDPTSPIQAQLNGKQASLTLTTTGTSGAATLTGATLNIPQYSSGFTNPMTTVGDIIYGGTAGAATRLGIGGAHTLLHGGASAPSYSAVDLASADVTGLLPDANISSASTWNAKFTLPSLTNHSVLFSDGSTIAQDNSNFYYDQANHRLSVATNGDQTGTNAINIYGQYDAYEPQSAIGAVTDAATYPGVTTSSSRGTGASPVINNTGDNLGGFSGWGYTGSSPAYAYFGGMSVSAVGTTANNLGGQLDFYVKANNSTPSSALQIFNNSTSRFIGNLGVGQLTAVAGTPGVSTLGTGGALPAGTYYYKIVTVDYNGNQTTASTEVSGTVTGTTSKITLTWTAVSGATSYNIYRGTSAGAESIYYSSTTNNYVDVNGTSTGGTVPTVNTSAMVYINSNGVVTASYLGLLGLGGGNVATNIAGGTEALLSNTTGANNTGFGYHAGRNISSASSGFNVYIGSLAAETATGGSALSNATVIGYSALQTGGGSGPTIIGSNAGKTSTGNYVTLIGFSAGASLTSGHDIVGVGVNAGAYFGGSFGAAATIHNGVYLGNNSFASANGVGNEIAIGDGVLGLGANTTTIGNTSTTKTYLYGQLSTAEAQTSVNGSTSGTALFSQPFFGAFNKEVVIYCNALNGTATYTFPTAFSQTPVVLSTSGLATGLVTTLNTTTVTVTGSTSTGFLFIKGY